MLRSFQSPLFLCILSIAFLVLGCSGDGDASAQSSSGGGPTALEGTAGAALDDLAPGTYAVTLTGAIESDGTWSNPNRPASIYDPWVRGDNNGPYQLLMRVDLSAYNIDGSNMTPDEGEVLFVFPAGLSLGTYDLVGVTRDAPDDAVQVEVRAGTGSLSQAFDEEVNGTLTFAQTGSQISGSFDLSAMFELLGRGTEHTVEARGRFSAIPFEPEPVSKVQFTGAASLLPSIYMTNFRPADYPGLDVPEYELQMIVGNPSKIDEEGYGEIRLYLPASLGAGTYDVVARNRSAPYRPSGADAAASVRFETPDGTDLEPESVTGTLTITSDDPQSYGVTFELSGQTANGAMTVTGEGQYLEL